MPEDADRSRELVDKLNLKHLNVESGLFNVVRVSDIEVDTAGEFSPASNAIYLALNQDEPFNYLQWVFCDDYQVLIEGGPADYYLFYDDSRSEKITMGRDIAAGQLIWLDMQLDQKQLTNQLRRFAQQQPGKEAILRVEDGAPKDSVELVIRLATEAGVSIDNPWR